MASKTREDILTQAKAARENRLIETSKTKAAIKIQTWARCRLQRKRFLRIVRELLDKSLTSYEENQQQPVKSIFNNVQLFIRCLDLRSAPDVLLFERLARYITRSIPNENIKFNYAGLALDKMFTQQWVIQVKKLLVISLEFLKSLNHSSQPDGKRSVLILNLLLSLTSSRTWGFLKNSKPLEVILEQVCINIVYHLVDNNLYKCLHTVLSQGVCSSRVTIKTTNLNALITLSVRPLCTQYKADVLSQFIIHILSIPSLLYHMKTQSVESIETMMKCNILANVIKYLEDDQNSKIVFNALEGSYSLCLLANLIDLVHLSSQEEVQAIIHPKFVTLSTRLLDSCQLYVAAKKSNLTQWHPLLGWFAQTNCDHAEAMPFVERQLQHLWSRNFVLQVFHCLNIFTGDVEVPYFQIKDDKNSFTKFFWKAMKMDDVMKKGLDKYNTKQSFKLGSHEVTRVVQSAVLYEACLRTLSLLRIDILTSLAFCEDFLMKFWIFLKCLGPQCGLKSFLQLLAVNSKATAPEFLMLQLFGELMNHFLTVTDDVELFEQQKSFTIQDLLMMSQFINVFLVRAIWNGYIDAKSLSTRGPMLALHSLLMTLHKRDLRKTFAPDGFWLSTDPKSSYILLELERNKRHAQTLIQKMPHVIPHADRVILFRYYVVKEKTFLGLTETSSVAPQSTLVTIRRSRLIEDGFRQLSFLSPQATKGIIRIKFINDLGLDEAGIDQDGVFKEFLEETLKRIFDPSLNLFKMTSEQKLYPSPSSYMTENHLELFEFVGRMLGKAVYEGITVDIQFAPFFLHQLLGQSSLAAYSALDDLASLDPDLYRNLTYLKHFDGDVSELQLTFSVDEEVLGRLSTFDIIPGGRATPVTDSNKINYVHQMAHFKLNTQIKDQTQAFLRGFRTVVNPEWLALFSCTELQRLISGDTTGIDFKDLRRNTHYYGGFHDSHRVIQWLWDIVEKELTEVEQRKFLKFVTSCSSPPLLGFGNLEPPFSVRCVEVGDDEDRGDTIGSVLRGFLTLHRKDPVNRLPTASTCFNLLKLPNYQKKATLREKLKYAIESNSGFELS